jgi:hypothetical protein
MVQSGALFIQIRMTMVSRMALFFPKVLSGHPHRYSVDR